MLGTSERAAVAKAVETKTAAKVIRVQHGTYLVPSATTDERYVVTVKDGRYACTCPAGLHGKPCYHSAAVLVRKTEEAARGRVRVTAPAAGVQLGTPAPVAAPRQVRRVELV